MPARILDRVLGQALAAAPELSDVLLAPNRPVQVEAHGRLATPALSPALPALTAHQTETLALELLGGSRRLLADLAREGSCDLAHQTPDGDRFRVNVFTSRGSVALVLRLLPRFVPTLEDLGLPKVLSGLCRERSGLILVAGATGSGKTTTLAAMIEAINAVRPVHVVTLEDPVEYLFEQKRATISQRELGADFPDFAMGLRAAMRQAPKVIGVGEIRDRETVEAALRAAETGHLVLATVHADDAPRAITRLTGLFEASEERLIRQSLAANLRAVAAQRLVPRLGGGRVAAVEVLTANLRVREMLLKGESGEATLHAAMAGGAPFGMATLDQRLADLFSQGLVDEQTALTAATDPAALSLELAARKRAMGQSPAVPSLELDSGDAPDMD